MGQEGVLLGGCSWCDKVGMGERKNWKEEASLAFPYPCLHLSVRKPKSAETRLTQEPEATDLLLRCPQIRKH